MVENFNSFRVDDEMFMTLVRLCDERVASSEVPYLQLRDHVRQAHNTMTSARETIEADRIRNALAQIVDDSCDAGADAHTSADLILQRFNVSRKGEK